MAGGPRLRRERRRRAESRFPPGGTRSTDQAPAHRACRCPGFPCDLRGHGRRVARAQLSKRPPRRPRLRCRRRPPRRHQPVDGRIRPRGGARYLERAVERTSRLPGVSGVAFAEDVPLGFSGGGWEDIDVDGYRTARNEDMKVYRNLVSPGYFELMRIPLDAGRDFTSARRCRCADGGSRERRVRAAVLRRKGCRRRTVPCLRSAAQNHRRRENGEVPHARRVAATLFLPAAGAAPESQHRRRIARPDFRRSVRTRAHADGGIAAD